MSGVVAIDGPSGAGKGTVARAVAAAFAFAYVDTGAMYRAVAWRTLDAGGSLEDAGAVAEVARTASFALSSEGVVIDGRDVTSEIRTPKMDKAAATVARMPRVREALVARQREYAANGNVVMEGRDIGTVVFPDAAVKIYLDASPEERAARRSKDPAHGASQGTTLTDIASALRARDHSDRTRQASPLTRAPDAVLINTTGVSIEQVVDLVTEIVRERIGG